MRPEPSEAITVHTLGAHLERCHPSDLVAISDLICSFIEHESSNDPERLKEPYAKDALVEASEKATTHRAIIAGANAQNFNMFLKSFAELLGKTHAYIHMLENSGYADKVLRAQGFFESAIRVEEQFVRISQGLGSSIWMDEIEWAGGYIDARARPDREIFGRYRN